MYSTVEVFSFKNVKIKITLYIIILNIFVEQNCHSVNVVVIYLTLCISVSKWKIIKMASLVSS